VLRVFPDLSYRSLQTWVKRGAIVPAVPARRQGAASRFDYLNLIEIGLVIELVKFGYDRHPLLARLMKGARSGKTPWLNDMNYDCFLLVKDSTFYRQPATGPVRNNDGTIDQEATTLALIKRAQQKPIAAWHLLRHEELVGLFVRPDFSGALVVDIRTVKAYVDKALA
jgi:hypothetical protein